MRMAIPVSVLTVLLLSVGTSCKRIEAVGDVECAPWASTGLWGNRCGSLVPDGALYARLKGSLNGRDEAEFSDLKDSYISGVFQRAQATEQDTNCTQILLNLLCTVTIPSCSAIGDTGYKWRDRVCTSDCQRLYDSCPAQVQVIRDNQPLLDVFGISLECGNMTYDDPWTTNDLTLNYSATSAGPLDVHVDGKVYQMPCRSPYTGTVAVCRGDRVPDDGGECQPKCPLGSKVYRDEQWHNFDKAWQVSGWLSLVCSLMMVATWSLQRRKRVFPSRFLLYFSSCLLLTSVSMVLSSLVGEADIRCDNETTPQTGALSGACMTQGILWMLGSLGLTLWWLAFVVTLFLIIFCEMETATLREREWVFHCVVWPLCFIPTLIMVVGGLVRYNPAGLSCFISNEDGPGWQLALYYIPQLLCLGVGTILMCAILLRVCRNARRVRTYKALKVVLRFMVFIPLYVVIQCVFLVATMNKLDVNDLLVTNHTIYNDCLIREAALVGGNYAWDVPPILDGCAEEAFGSVRQYSLDMTSRVLWGLMGVWTLIVFGFQRENIRFWRKVLGSALGLSALSLYSRSRKKTASDLSQSSAGRGSSNAVQLSTPTAHQRNDKASADTIARSGGVG